MTETSGALAIRHLHEAGVDHLFTLSGAHIFPLYDGCRHEGVRIVDTRHEQTAMFAAEGLAKLTRRPQVAALTAGPGTALIYLLVTAAALLRVISALPRSGPEMEMLMISGLAWIGAFGLFVALYGPMLGTRRQDGGRRLDPVPGGLAHRSGREGRRG
jgi:hypothetical protein